MNRNICIEFLTNWQSSLKITIITGANNQLIACQTIKFEIQHSFLNDFKEIIQYLHLPRIFN